MKFEIFMLILLLLTQVVNAEQICKIQDSNLLCNDVKNPSLWDKAKSYGSQNPTTFWIILIILLISIGLLLNWVYENKNSDKILIKTLLIILIPLALFILTILVIT